MDAPFKVAEGKTIKVYRVDNDKLIECPTTYADGKVTFETNHFSTYVFAEADDVVEKSNNSNGHIFIIIAVVVVVAGAAVAGVIIMKKKKVEKNNSEEEAQEGDSAT